MARRVLKEVRSVYGKDKWTKAVIKSKLCVCMCVFFYHKQVVPVDFFFPILHYALRLVYISTVN